MLLDDGCQANSLTGNRPAVTCHGVTGFDPLLAIENRYVFDASFVSMYPVPLLRYTAFVIIRTSLLCSAAFVSSFLSVFSVLASGTIVVSLNTAMHVPLGAHCAEPTPLPIAETCTGAPPASEST